MAVKALLLNALTLSVGPQELHLVCEQLPAAVLKVLSMALWPNLLLLWKSSWIKQKLIITTVV